MAQATAETKATDSLIEWVGKVQEVKGRKFESGAHVVGERSVGLRRSIVRLAGGIGSANADISNDKTGEKPVRRKPKVSCATFIGAG